MLTPADKVKHGNDIIQVVITRKCDIHTCSNCTQLLPFRKDAAEMTLDCVEAALKSVQDWPGVVACFGGNPCTHSKFEEVCKLWQHYIPQQNRRGLWTNNLMRHGSIIKDTFYPHGRFNLNVHGDSDAATQMQKWLPGIKVWGLRQSRHGGMIGNYADYGYTYDEWSSLREKCDINRNWSAGIYQRDCPACFATGKRYSDDISASYNPPCGACEGKKYLPYAYFCEVAGSIDGVTGENNGIPAVPGWWQNTIDRYSDQIQNCCDKNCIVPLRTVGSFDNESTYDISPSAERLTVGFKGKNLKIKVHGDKQDSSRELTDYIGIRGR
jgi:hypothetical protein